MPEQDFLAISLKTVKTLIDIFLFYMVLTYMIAMNARSVGDIP